MEPIISVIMPYVNEWPQIVFTIRAVHEALIPYSHEIIVVDNYCKEVANQGSLPDRGHTRYIKKGNKNDCRFAFTEEEADALNNDKNYDLASGHLEAIAKTTQWLVYEKYSEKLSHWNAKNKGVQRSVGEVLLFLDAHVSPSRGSLEKAVREFADICGDTEFDTLHMPLSYHILESKRLIYKPIYDFGKGIAHYSFTSMPVKEETCFEVSCMSTCGMFMTRKLFDRLGGWPKGMGIYGGGENFINYVLSIIGSKKWISNYGCLHHHGDKRKYSFNWNDYHTNRMIATYLYGDYDWAEKYQKALGDNDITRKMLSKAVLEASPYKENIDNQRVFKLDEWFTSWGM